MADIPGHADDSIKNFLDHVSKLINECERRKNVAEESVILYMRKRITSCKHSLESLKSAFTLKIREIQFLNENDLDELIQHIDTIEKIWMSKEVKSTVHSRADFSCFDSFNVETLMYGKKGRPSYSFDVDQVSDLRELGFTYETISKILGVHRTTLWRALKKSGYVTNEYSTISDRNLDDLILEIKQLHPLSGEVVIRGILRSKFLKIQRHRVRSSIHRVDPINTALRWIRKNPRMVYSVPGPNALWHNDGLHKLIRWKFVIHCCIDGYSRVITSLLCATNNLAATALEGFLSGVSKYGLPSRVRGDRGSENNDIERYVNRERGPKSYIRGPSVHNQRIERSHYDTTHCALAHFIQLFSFLEDNEVLDACNEIDIFALQFVYTPRIQKSLDEFREGWNHHPLSTEGCRTPYHICRTPYQICRTPYQICRTPYHICRTPYQICRTPYQICRTPYQIWTLGMMDKTNQNQRGVRGVTCPEEIEDVDGYGIDPEVMNDIESDNNVELYDIEIGDRQEDILQALNLEFNCIEDDNNYGINTFKSVKSRIEDLLK